MIWTVRSRLSTKPLPTRDCHRFGSYGLTFRPVPTQVASRMPKPHPLAAGERALPAGGVGLVPVQTGVSSPRNLPTGHEGDCLSQALDPNSACRPVGCFRARALRAVSE